jgi:hypothetical protein
MILSIDGGEVGRMADGRFLKLALLNFRFDPLAAENQYFSVKPTSFGE